MMLPSRFGNAATDSSLLFKGDTYVKKNGVYKGGTFMMGGDNNQASADEFPKHKVRWLVFG